VADIFSTEQQDNIIPDSNIKVSRPLTPEGSDDKVSQSIVASKALGLDDEANIRASSKNAATFGGMDAVRKVISQPDYQLKQQKALAELADAINNQSTDIVANQLLLANQITEDKYALEDNVAKAAVLSLPQDIVDAVDENILQDIAEKQAFELKISNILEEKIVEEDRESLLNEFVDFFKVITGFQDIGRLAFAASKLPEEQQEAFLRHNLEDFLDDVEWGRNPASDVEFIQSALDKTGKVEEDMKFWQAIGVGAAIFDIASIFKAGKVMKNAGNSEAIADDILKAPDERTLNKTDSDVVQNISTFKAPGDESSGVLDALQKKTDTTS
jgi:hypothetical protein